MDKTQYEDIFIEKNFFEYKERTLDTYSKRIKKLRSEKNINPDNEIRIENLDKILQNESLSYQRTSYQSIIWYLQSKDLLKEETKYTEICKDLKKKIDELNNKNTDLQIKNEESLKITWETILMEYEKKYALMKNKKIKNKKDFEEFRDFTILSLYILFPVRGIIDYAYMCELPLENNYTDNNDKNYYVPQEKKFVFNKYKTRDGGRQIFEISENLSKILDTYIKKYRFFVIKKKYEEFLFGMSEKDMSRSIKKILKELMNIDITINKLKKVFEDFYFNKNISIEEINKIKEKMGMQTN